MIAIYPELRDGHNLEEDKVIESIVYKIDMDITKSLWEETPYFYACYSSEITVDKLENELKDEIINHEILGFKRLENVSLEKRFFDISDSFNISLKSELKGYLCT